MIDPLATWIAEFKKLPQDLTGNDSPKNIANFIDQRVTNKLDLNNSIAKFDPTPIFTWQKSIFQAVLTIIAKMPSPEVISPAIKMANAWQSATLASTFIISAGAAVSPPPPATDGIAATAVAVIDPATLALAYSGLISDLSSVGPVNMQADAELPKAIYKAFTKITYTITGIDTKPPPVGPIPIILPLTAVQ